MLSATPRNPSTTWLPRFRCSPSRRVRAARLQTGLRVVSLRVRALRLTHQMAGRIGRVAFVDDL